MSPTGVRRGKAALFSGCQSHPATAPAESNRSSHRVTKWLKPLVNVSRSESASVQAVMRVNAKQASRQAVLRERERDRSPHRAADQDKRQPVSHTAAPKRIRSSSASGPSCWCRPACAGPLPIDRGRARAAGAKHVVLLMRRKMRRPKHLQASTAEDLVAGERNKPSYCSVPPLDARRLPTLN